MMSKPMSKSSRTLLIAPYHLYTHSKEFRCLTARMAELGWQTDFLLPFTVPATIDAMAAEARQIRTDAAIHDLACRFLMHGGQGALARMARAASLIIYFIRTCILLLTLRPDGLVLTSDLGGISIRFIQMLAVQMRIPIFVLQTTLFLRQAEREDLKFQFRPAWLHRLLNRGALKRLFLFFGEVPGTFLRSSWLAVQNEEIASICSEFGKPPAQIEIVGSYQAALIAEQQIQHGTAAPATRPQVLLLSECVAERFGMPLALEHLEWMVRGLGALPREVDVVMRFHPREAPEYRKAALARLSDHVRVDMSADPAASAACADVVVGAFSMLLFDAQSAGIPAIFLDVGCDPIGFYSSRRRPLVNSGVALRQALEDALAARRQPAAQAPSSVAWADTLLRWIEDRIAGHGQKSLSTRSQP